jgi:phage I-like protein
VGKHAKHGTAILSAGIELSKEGKAPSEIRLLKEGQNDSDYGPFVFDELAAALVMASFGNKGIPRLYADWNHEMLPKYDGERITREQGMSSCSFVPEVRNGELWASEIQWSAEGKADVEGGLYNLFSPAFAYDYGDDGLCRPRKLINFALVNLAGLNGIAPLIAAMAKSEEDQVEFEKLYNETKAQLDIANTRIKVLEAQGGEVVALSAAVGLRSDVPSTERLSLVQGLVTLRGSVFRLTGQESPEGAIAALAAMKVNADKAVVLEAKMEADATAALRASLDGIWEGAVKEGKLPPADRAEVEASLLGLTGGKVTPGVVSAAKTYVAKLSAIVKMGPGTTPPAGSVALSAERIEIARQFGRPLKDVEEFERKKLGQTA